MIPYHWQVHYHPAQISVYLGGKLKYRENKDMVCAAAGGISCFFLKSMAGMSVWERGRESEKEKEMVSVGVHLCWQIVQCVTVECNGEGTWAQVQMNCVADWTVSCNYLPCTSRTTTVIYPTSRAFLPLLPVQISPTNENRLWLSLCQYGGPHNGSLALDI